MINKVILVGDVWKDPEIKTTTKSGTSMCLLNVVTKEFFKDSTGEYKEKKEWHTAVSFGNTACYISEKIKKGDIVYLEGQSQTRELVDKDNTEERKKNYIREIIIGRQGVVKKIFSRKREEPLNLIGLDLDNNDELKKTHDTTIKAENDDSDDDLTF